uniref:Uncharacterized protein n=1 Tax=Avena sativa TaxID=4498 RepID=A0ACD6A058_AVESA
MAGPRDELIEHLVGVGAEMGEPRQVQLPLKTATIYGPAGMGKTTLANLVYEMIGSKFDSRAFVSVPPGGNTTEVLARIFEQVAADTSVPVASTEASMEEHLIDIISNFLKDKRYLVIIDDIWNWKEWEVIAKSLPENNLGSRIVGTTSINEVAKKLCKDLHGPNALLHKLLPEWKNKKGWAYKIDNVDITTQMIVMKANLLAEGFDYEHPIVHMCDGTPLAVCCMLSAVAEERSKQALQGIHPKACDVQDKIQKQVMQNGIQNTPGFEPLVESFQLALDDVPHHMLKTCLLFSSIYPDGHNFVKKDLVIRWISEGFVYAEGEANGYFEELVNRGFFMQSVCSELGMHPMMRNFLGWKSRQDNFITCSSEITPSYNNTCRVRRLCIYNSPCGSRDGAEDPLSLLDWYHIQSLIVYEYIERVPFEKLERVRVLDLCWINRLLDHELKDICGLVRLRHLLGFERVHRIRQVPPEIVRLQCLETFETGGDEFTPLAGFIGDLQQLKTLVLRSSAMKELPREIARLQQLETLDISGTPITHVPKEIGSLQELKTLDISGTPITQLPKEIGSLQQLKTLDISDTPITQLPKEIGRLQQLNILDISRTPITQLPKEIVKLQHLEHLLMSGTQVVKLPREIVALKELKRLILGKSITALPLEVCALVELPDCIVEALNKSNLISVLASEMLSFKPSDFREDGGGGIVVGAKQMHIPRWIKEHFNDLSMLDVRICKLDEEGLKILREMPHLWKLTLRFEVVPTEPVVIGSQGFANLKILTVDSRMPRVTFQKGAMPKLSNLTFEFQFYNGQPNKDPVGTNHLSGLWRIDFVCNQDWYPGGGDSKCIRATIDMVTKEVRDSTSRSYGPILYVCGRKEAINLPVEMEEAMSSVAGETEDEIGHRILLWKEAQEQRRRTGAIMEKKEMISRVCETEHAIYPTIDSFITQAQELSSSVLCVGDRKEDMEMMSRAGETTTEHEIWPTIGSLIAEAQEHSSYDRKEDTGLPTSHPPPLEMGRPPRFYSESDNDIPIMYPVELLLCGKIKRKEHTRRRGAVAKVDKGEEEEHRRS